MINKSLIHKSDVQMTWPNAAFKSRPLMNEILSRLLTGNKINIPIAKMSFSEHLKITLSTTEEV